MVSISDQNPEFIRPTGSQQTSGQASPAVDNGAGIFRVNLTRTQAQQEGLSSLFTKYNADNDEVISQDEFNKYTEETQTEQQQDITSKSGKRTAVGGIYTVVKGDTLSKIAQDFGVGLNALYEANIDIIGPNINKLLVGWKINVGKVKNPSSTSSSNPTDDATSSSSSSSASSSSSGADGYMAEIMAKAKNNIAGLMKELGLNIDQAEFKQMIEAFEQMPEAQRKELSQKIFLETIGKYMDKSKYDEKFASMQPDQLLAMLGLSREELDKIANPAERGAVLGQALNRFILNDLDSNDENSRYHQEIRRIQSEGLNEEEKKLYAGQVGDVNNLTQQEIEEIAKASVVQYYTVNLGTMLQNTLFDNKTVDFQLLSHGFMASMAADDRIFSSILQTAKMNGSLQALQDKGFNLSDFASKYIKLGNLTEEDAVLTGSIVMETATQEGIENLYKNNQDYVDKLNEIAKYTANNTTDETRKAMLNNIVENSAQIAGSSQSSGSREAQSSAVTPAQVSVTSPIQNAQISYVTNLKAASEEFMNRNNKEEIPRHLRSAFDTVQEYQDFKGSGMTMAQYQKARALFKNNFQAAMNEIIKNYENIPDKYKPKVLAFFDSMDDNTRGELFISGTEEMRLFMNKYNYMTSEKLLDYVEKHPAEMKEATVSVERMVKELQKEQAEEEARV